MQFRVSVHAVDRVRKRISRIFRVRMQAQFHASVHAGG
jgi:hypothetical protein